MKRLLKRGYLYKLVDFSQPIIANNCKMLSNNNKGGVWLKYKVSKITYFSFLNHDYVLFSNTSYSHKYFFNPLKKDWNREAYKISKIYWGKKQHLLTNMWLEVDAQFKDIFSVTKTKLAKVPQCKDKELIKKLNTRKEVFVLSNIKSDKNEKRQ